VKSDSNSLLAVIEVDEKDMKFTTGKKILC